MLSENILAMKPEKIMSMNQVERINYFRTIIVVKLADFDTLSTKNEKKKHITLSI